MVRFSEKSEQIQVEISISCWVQKTQMSASDRSQKTRETKEVTADTCFSTRLEVKGRGVEVLRWLMQCVTSMEQIICRRHENERSYVGRQRTTPSFQRTHVELHLKTEAGQNDSHRDQQWKLTTHSCSRI